MEDKFPLLRLASADLKDRLKRMVPFMSTEETRHYLNGVLFHYKDDNLTLCATNCHILQEQIFVVEPELSENYGGEFEVIVPRNAIDHLVKILPSDDEGLLTMQVIDGGKNVRFDFFSFEYITEAIDGKFPDYKGLIPKGKVKLQTGLNARYLVAALKALNNKAVDICVDNKEDADTSAHLLTSSEVDGTRCVIMPMRAD
jgi:DNA polymerase III sliding clamp (beta) subunit (PCNA family)